MSPDEYDGAIASVVIFAVGLALGAGGALLLAVLFGLLGHS